MRLLGSVEVGSVEVGSVEGGGVEPIAAVLPEVGARAAERPVRHRLRAESFAARQPWMPVGEGSLDPAEARRIGEAFDRQRKTHRPRRPASIRPGRGEDPV